MATRTPESALHIPDLEKYPAEEQYMREVTGQVPREIRFVKNAHTAITREFPEAASAVEKIHAAIDKVETETIRQAGDEIDRTFDSLLKSKKQPFIDYLGHILLPPWYGGLPKVRDGQLYDKGFIFQDKNPAVLRPINGPARRSLLQLFLREAPAANTVDVRGPLVSAVNSCVSHSFCAVSASQGHCWFQL